jgi:kynurenine formamidase
MSWEFELIDLSRPLTEETAVAMFGNIGSPVYNKVDVEYLVNWPEKNGRVTKFSVLDHFGTHMDAPIHTVRDGADLSGVDITRLIGEAVVLDMYKGDVDYGYTAEDFEAQAEHVHPGDIVLIHSGYVPCRSMDDPIRQTYVTPEAAQWLVDHGVRAVGCEPAGLEHGTWGYLEYRWYDLDTPNPPPWPAHGILLGHDVYIIEGLVNLDRIKGQRVRFAALPLNVPELSGCPVRAVAWIER